MKPELFDWEEFQHGGYCPADGFYELDFSNNHHRPFKEKYRVRLYKDGPLEISATPYQDPALARSLKEQMGLDFRLLSDCTGIVFRTFDGAVIRKSGIEGVTMFLLDHQHKVALHPRREVVTYYGPHAWPAGGAEFTVKVPDKQRAKKLKWALSDAIKLGFTYFQLDGKQSCGGVSLDAFMEAFLTGKASLDNLTPEKNPQALWELGHAVANRCIDSRLNRWSEHTVETTQIRFEVK